MEAASVNIEHSENDEIDSFSDGGDAGCLSAASLGTEILFSKIKNQHVCSRERNIFESKFSSNVSNQTFVKGRVLDLEKMN